MLLAYLHSTLAHSKDQGHAHFDQNRINICAGPMGAAILPLPSPHACYAIQTEFPLITIHTNLYTRLCG